jgi:alkaline phosphatase
MFRKFSLLLILLAVYSYNVLGQEVSVSKKGTTEICPKNIVLLIGDGMGLSQVSASLFYNEGKSNFERFPVVGLIKTSASGDLVTDSAAAATAFASGVKTYNGAIGVDKDSKPVPTIVEQFSAKGMATGIIATSSITHATPACFYAHVQDRDQAYDIAAFLPKSDIDFFAGGGRKYFNKRKDNINLLNELETGGFVVSLDKLPVKNSDGKQAILLAENEMPKMQEGRGNFLLDATRLALENLSKNKEGFFLMVEASQIDWGGHDNDTNYLIQEQLDFDKTIGLVLDFAAKNSETLVLVTADHETGGFTLAIDNGDYNKIKPSFSTGGHSATMVPVFAMGPGAYLFGGIYDNTDIYYKMIQAIAH